MFKILTQDNLKQRLYIYKENGTEDIEKLAKIFPLFVLNFRRNFCLYMTLCGSLRDERRRVRYTRILIFVIDELSRIRHLIGF